jgi:hypothetical protein
MSFPDLQKSVAQLEAEQRAAADSGIALRMEQSARELTPKRAERRKRELARAGQTFLQALLSEAVTPKMQGLRDLLNRNQTVDQLWRLHTVQHEDGKSHFDSYQGVCLARNRQSFLDQTPTERLRALAARSPEADYDVIFVGVTGRDPEGVIIKRATGTKGAFGQLQVQLTPDVPVFRFADVTPETLDATLTDLRKPTSDYHQGLAKSLIEGLQRVALSLPQFSDKR